MKQLIVITHASSLKDETSLINTMFDEGLSLLHVRKLEYSSADLTHFINAIKPVYHERLVLPANLATTIPELFPKVRRIHFFEYLREKSSPEALNEWKLKGYQLSTSIHDAATYQILSAAFDYIFFSPVFDSISKQGYNAMSEEQLDVRSFKKEIKLIALGGVDASNCQTALRYGFDGVAVLGAVWLNDNPVKAFKEIQRGVQSSF